jgi:hypothetical protein
MYAIRCTVYHPKSSVVFEISEKSNYIILVDTPKLNTAFDVAKRAMDNKYHQLYMRECFEFSSGAQKLAGSLNGELVKILFTNS